MTHLIYNHHVQTEKQPEKGKSDKLVYIYYITPFLGISNQSINHQLTLFSLETISRAMYGTSIVGLSTIECDQC
jgi:hypothetical protein